ncbi:MAG: EF-hand domain-containing protein [Thiomonas sp.]|uniref:EF-hand domain-containing protein n=1 Tax=Thiomonas sp. TaxID=2047785 RepID=UPI002A369168|nr:EF-hand domain-containing protein [Thiomonas sp.]MDY0330474.1 EF-hand domain-containing protein [Thiomonas sp.]
MPSILSTRLILVCCALAAVSIAQAQTAPPGASRAQQVLAERFARADADHDGRLTLAEAKTGMPRVAQHFDRLDTNHLGYLTLDQLQAELQAGLRRRQASRQ